MTRFLLVVALVTMALSLGACGRYRRYKHSRYERTSPVAIARRQSVARGHTAYLRYCALCHGSDGQGYAADHANAITNPDFLSIATDDFLRAAINDGRPGTAMSAWGTNHAGPLTLAVTNDLVAFLRSHARLRPVQLANTHLTGDANRARPVWSARCKSCHGEVGAGSNTTPSLSHPNFQHEVTDSFLRYTIEHGRRGTPMVSFAGLGPATIDDLVALIRSFDPAPGVPINLVMDTPPPLEDIVLNPHGRAPNFTLTDGRYVPCAQVAQALASHARMVILDARATSDWSRERIPGAAPFPFYNIETMASRLPRDDTWILAYCACPHAASGHVVDELRRRGFEHTAVIDEGIHYWVTHGYPTAGTGPHTRPSDAELPGKPPPVPPVH